MQVYPKYIQRMQHLCWLSVVEKGFVDVNLYSALFVFLKFVNFSFVPQRIHRRRNDRGAETGEGRRDQHLLRGFGPSVWAVPQVSVGDVTRLRTEDPRLNHNPPQADIPSSYVNKDFNDFSVFVLQSFYTLSGLWCCRFWRTPKLQSSSGSLRITCPRLSR